jgi:hypothetical protein
MLYLGVLVPYHIDQLWFRKFGPQSSVKGAGFERLDLYNWMKALSFSMRSLKDQDIVTKTKAWLDSLNSLIARFFFR